MKEPDGLAASEARRRLALEGPNELPARRHGGAGRLLAEILREPLIALLVAATLLYLAFGEPKDALLLTGSVIVIVAIEFYQGHRTERAIEALRSMALPDVRVRRDGSVSRIRAREVVRGDWIVISEGDRVPADAWVRSGEDLLVDESLLTGESVPVRKSPWDGHTPWAKPGGDDLGCLFGQTLVVRGEGFAEVRSTGTRTEASRIADALVSVERETPLLQRQTRNLVFTIAGAAVVLSTLVAVLIGSATGDWIPGLLAGIALAIALLPEEIPIVLTVYSALGARRMARQHALARRLSAIPTLGAVTVLCTDKTGTLTLNRMVVDRLVPSVPGSSPADTLSGEGTRRLSETALRASDPASMDPTELAVLSLRIPEPESSSRTAQGFLERKYPLRPAYRALTQVWREPSGRQLVATKGAPEDVLNVCRMESPTRTAWHGRVEEMARGGLRVLAVARAELDLEHADRSLPEDPAAFPLEFVGLIGLADPVRPDVPRAIAECRAAGIRVIVITGDHPETARNVARAAGIADPDRVRTGAEVAGLSPEALAETVRSVNVYARFGADEKLGLVEALKRDGQIVAMTGDGVNDAPALRAAHIGVAMGQRGTDVAREVASLVLLDDSFPSIVDAIRSGRRIFANMRKAIGYLLAIHIAIAGMALLPVILGLPLLIYPVEIVFLQFIIDPTSALSFEAEPEERDVMRVPPRDPEEPLFRWSELGLSLLQGAAALGVTMFVYELALGAVGTAEARSLAFTTLVIANLSLIFVHRSESTVIPTSLAIPNPVLWIVVAVGGGIVLSSIYLPPIAQLFGFAHPPPPWLVAAVLAGIFGVLWVEPIKAYGIRRRARLSAAREPPGASVRS